MTTNCKMLFATACTPMYKILLVILFIGCCQSRAQVNAVSNTGGGSATVATNFVMDWSIGEAECIQTHFVANPFPNPSFGTSWNATCGILQPYDKNQIILMYPISTWAKQEINISPNPTPNKVHINFRLLTDGNQYKITIHLLTRDGAVLGTQEIMQVNGSSTIEWDLSRYPAGVYTFRVILRSDVGNSNYPLKTGSFPVIKL